MYFKKKKNLSIVEVQHTMFEKYKQIQYIASSLLDISDLALLTWSASSFIAISHIFRAMCLLIHEWISPVNSYKTILSLAASRRGSGGSLDSGMASEGRGSQEDNSNAVLGTTGLGAMASGFYAPPQPHKGSANGRAPQHGKPSKSKKWRVEVEFMNG